MVEESLGYPGNTHIFWLVHILRRGMVRVAGRLGGGSPAKNWRQEKVQDQRFVISQRSLLKSKQTVHPAFSTFLLALGLAFGIILRFGPESFTFFYDRWVGFVTASVLTSVIQAAGCYYASYQGERLLALGGNTGNPIYDVRYLT